MTSQLNVDTIKGQTTAGSVTIQGEGTATTNLQQGLAKVWGQGEGDTTTLIDSFNQVSLHDPPPEISLIYKNVPEINELDNRGFKICRPLFSHSSLPNTLDLDVVEVDDFDFKSEFSYFVYVHHNQPLWAKHLDLIPKKVLDGVRSGKGKLIFDNSLEGERIDGRFFINPFYESIAKLNLPTENIYFITNNLIAEKTHNEYNRKDKINVISIMWNVFDVQRLKKLKHLPNKINIQKCPKKFSGTEIKFYPDPEIFENINFSPKKLFNLIKMKSVLVKGTKISFKIE